MCDHTKPLQSILGKKIFVLNSFVSPPKPTLLYFKQFPKLVHSLLKENSV